MWLVRFVLQGGSKQRGGDHAPHLITQVSATHYDIVRPVPLH